MLVIRFMWFLTIFLFVVALSWLFFDPSLVLERGYMLPFALSAHSQSSCCSSYVSLVFCHKPEK